MDNLLDNLKKYYGILILLVAIYLSVFAVIKTVIPAVQDVKKYKTEIENAQKDKENVTEKLNRVKDRIKKTKNALATSQKKVYTPIESDLEQDTLFFTLYNDVVDMIEANGVKIKAINYTYNPEDDTFVQFGKDVYFVSDVDMELVANYINLGKFIQDIYQYPYYIRINNLEVLPYEKDKKILHAMIRLRLYTHTASDNQIENTVLPENVSTKQEQ